MARNVKTAAANAGGLTALQTERVGELIAEEAAARRGRIDSGAIKEIIDRVRRETAAATADKLTLSRIFDEVESRVPTLLFMGMPVFALILKVLHWRSRRYYIEHLIFSIHLHTWAFLAFMVGNGYFKLAALGPSWLTTLFAWLLAGWMVWYVFRAFRIVYDQRPLKTLVKMALVGGGYLVALVGLTGAITSGQWHSW